ncbi:MAG: hypothetical protein GY730_01995 [bacterium]|nr:hypothetical protein [bacterium]
MDIGRRRFIKSISGAVLLISMGSTGLLKYFAADRALRAVKPDKYPGDIKKMKDKDVLREAVWKG